MREAVPTSDGAEDMNTSGYELSDMESIDLIFLGKTSAGIRSCLWTKDRHYLFTNSLQRLRIERKRIIRKPHCVGWSRRQGQLPFNHSSDCASHCPSQVDGKLSFWRTDWKCAGLRLHDFCLKEVVVCAFSKVLSIIENVSLTSQSFSDLVTYVWEEDSSSFYGIFSGSKVIHIQSPYSEKSGIAESEHQKKPLWSGWQR